MSATEPDEPDEDGDAPEIEFASDRHGTELRAKAARRAGDRRDDALAAMCSRPETRAWLLHLLSTVCCVEYGAHQPGGGALDLAWRDGRRSVGLQLLADIHRVDPGAWATMTAERRADAERFKPKKVRG